jgi:hypothetical protein
MNKSLRKLPKPLREAPKLMEFRSRSKLTITPHHLGLVARYCYFSTVASRVKEQDHIPASSLLVLLRENDQVGSSEFLTLLRTRSQHGTAINPREQFTPSFIQGRTPPGKAFYHSRIAANAS